MHEVARKHNLFSVSEIVAEADLENFEKYIDITGSSELEEKNYFSQPIELDATAFAYYLMQHLHPNINPRSLYVPKYAVDYIKKSRGFYQSFFQVADQNKRYYF